MTFPKDFLWGAATASYQIEGAAQEDGRGECIWTRFSHTPGNVQDGDTGDVACDHYHLYRDDVKMMKDLGLHTYRFSISWPRVIPAGTGPSNPKGIDFYDRLVDELLAVDIKPFATLYHWDLPQALQDRGGWENPSIVEWFADYADLMSQRLGDRVNFWATHNEPWVVAFIGNYIGRHAPGKTDLNAALKVAHHLILTHASGTKAIKSNLPDAQVGIVLNTSWAIANTDSEDDQRAASIHDGYVHRWFLDPIYNGHYPADMVEVYRDYLDDIDIDAVKTANAIPLDYLGVNYYKPEILEWNPDNPPLFDRAIRREGVYTEMDWLVYPQGLRDVLIYFHENYPVPEVYVTENGVAFNDGIPENGVLHDPDRLEFLRSHFQSALEAIEAGVPLKGYYVWSLMDNFEWGYGYSKRFGITHIDYQTLKRTPKASSLWYKRVIAANGIVE
jgi:beta-glucosidase